MQQRLIESRLTPNTISLTGLQGSNKTNVIPPEASAKLDIRLLPDQDPAAMLATLKRIVNDTAVHFTTDLQPKTPLESPINTDLFRAIERAAHDRDPNALVTTPMLHADQPNCALSRSAAPDPLAAASRRA